MILANVKYHEQRAAPGVYKIVFIKTKVFRNFAIAGSVICQITQWVLIILGMANTSQIILKTAKITSHIFVGFRRMVDCQTKRTETQV